MPGSSEVAPLACPSVVIERGGHAWRAGLPIPQAELRQVDVAAFFHAADEILAGRGGPVEPVEIEIGCCAEFVGPEDRRHHPDDFGALVVDRRGVEVRDLDIAFGPDGMRQRPGILGELPRAGAQGFWMPSALIEPNCIGSRQSPPDASAGTTQ